MSGGKKKDWPIFAEERFIGCMCTIKCGANTHTHTCTEVIIAHGSFCRKLHISWMIMMK